MAALKTQNLVLPLGFQSFPHVPAWSDRTVAVAGAGHQIPATWHDKEGAAVSVAGHPIPIIRHCQEGGRIGSIGVLE